MKFIPQCIHSKTTYLYNNSIEVYNLFALDSWLNYLRYEKWEADIKYQNNSVALHIHDFKIFVSLKCNVIQY